MKSKYIAGSLALFMGVWGVHRFYLGQHAKGVFYAMGFIILMAISINVNAPAIMAVCILAFIDAVLFFVMPKEEFDFKYNKEYWQRQTAFARPHYQDRVEYVPVHSPVQKTLSHKQKGIENFRDYDFPAAIQDFQKALEENFKDISIHFNLACCYSMIEDTESALFHLDKAFEFGFDDYERMRTHDALAYLRTQDRFSEFVKQGYRFPMATPVDKKENSVITSNLIDQIKKLGELREKGIITQEEFQIQKEKMLKPQH